MSNDREAFLGLPVPADQAASLMGISLEDFAQGLSSLRGQVAKLTAQRDALRSVVERIAFAENTRAKAIEEAKRVLGNFNQDAAS